jgi:VCBS repeat-containing protein
MDVGEAGFRLEAYYNGVLVDHREVYSEFEPFLALTVSAAAIDEVRWYQPSPDGFDLVSFDNFIFTINPNSAAVANDDANSTTESASVPGNVKSNDTDAEDDAFSVTAVNDDTTKVGQPLTLSSGAIVTLDADGTYTYNPNGAFNYLVSAEKAVNSGAADTNTTATDSFTYTITGGDTATVTVTITGEDGPGDRLMGSSGDNTITGTPAPDFFDLSQGGNDSVSGLGSRDVFYFGAAFTAADTVNGGGNSDIVALQGDYSAPVSIGSITNLGMLGSISLVTHTNNFYGGADATPNSYWLVSPAVAPGETLKINGHSLAPGENLIVESGDEVDGSFLILGGKGVDTLTGGALGDIFFFGTDGRFGSGDSLNAGSGYDVVYLRGDYTLDFNSSGFDVGTLFGIESIGLQSATDTTYAGGGDGEFDYSLTWNDAMLGDSRLITINGSRLGENESMFFDGRGEMDGQFRLFGGAGGDDLLGGVGNDLILGGLNGDRLSGGGGNDVFRYQSTEDSRSSGNRDGIQDFSAGDLIDLQRIDADVNTDGNQAFTFIEDAAFSGVAGQLRAVKTDGFPFWTVEADVDGDRNADMTFFIDTIDADLITASDFML